MESGETLADVAHRFNVTTSVLASANRAEVDAPEAGSFIAIPVAYPGDRVAVKSAKVVRKPGTKVVATASKPAAIQSASTRPAVVHPAAVAHSVPAVAQHKPATKSISKAPQTKPAARS
jgi:hypothetical protein